MRTEFDWDFGNDGAAKLGMSQKRREQRRQRRAAGEQPIEGMDKDAMVEGLRARGHRSVVPLPGPDSLAEMVHAIARPGDYVVCLGAGNITAWAHALPEQLTALQGRGPRRAAAGGGQ